MQRNDRQVIPAKAGIQGSVGWTPAFAGVTATLRLAASVALGALALVGLAACSGAKPGNPKLPVGFEEQGVPQADLNAYLYFNNGQPVVVPVEGTVQAGTEVTVKAEVTVASVQGVMREPEREVALRVALADEAQAELVASHAKRVAGDEPTVWMERQGSAVVAGRSGDAWGGDLRAAWKDGRYATVESRYPMAWEMMRLLPSDPPHDAVAAGFVRNVSDLLEPVLTAQNVSIPGLSGALGLVRVDTLAFGMYADGLESLPAEVDADAIKDLGLGVVAVTKAGYPGFVVNFMLGQFASRVGLEAATVDGKEVRYRLVEDNLHLMMKSYGATLFLVAAPTKAGAEELMKAVIKDQG